MRTTIYKAAGFGIIAFLAMISCKQINKSFEETITPKPEKRAAASNGADSGSYTVSETHSSTSTTVVTHTTDGSSTGSKNIFEDAGALDSIQEALKNLPQFKGKKLMLYQSLYFNDFQGGRIGINIQNPDTTENIDTYVYEDGKWQAPSPVKVVGSIDKEVDFLMPLDDIKFSAAKKINDIANEQLKEVPGGQRNGFIYFNCMRIKRLNRLEAGWYLQIRGSRSDVRLDFNVDGSLKGVKKM